MTDIAALLRETKTVLLVDWPTREVPDALARSGFTVVSHDGPDADEYNAYEVAGEEVRIRRVGRPPAKAELVYTHRPIDELPEIVETARAIGAKAVWVQSGRDPDGTKDPHGCWMAEQESATARRIVESAGLSYIEAPYIAEAVRAR